jgi:hypothetical protein
MASHSLSFFADREEQLEPLNNCCEKLRQVCVWYRVKVLPVEQNEVYVVTYREWMFVKNEAANRVCYQMYSQVAFG